MEQQGARPEKNMVHAVTGAFGYSGRHLTRRLLDEGVRVRTLTGHPDRTDPFDGRVSVRPLDFGDPARLVESLRGVGVLYNTYWVRFPHHGQTHARAVRNTIALFDAAHDAGVGRIVHVSITNPDPGANLSYFSGKAALEEALRSSGISHAIVRPTVLFGGEDVLINNIAWLLRRLPVFGVFGKGDYRLQPVFVDDLAALMADLAKRSENVVIDAVGPEVYTYRDLVELIRREIGVRRPIVSVPKPIGLAAARLFGLLLGDVLITRDEIEGLSRNLLISSRPATCPTSFAAWLHDNREALGRRYANELQRHYR